MKGEIKIITHKQAVDFLLPKHYSGRTPQITKAFGWYIGNELVAVCTFGKPASHSLCIGLCGKEYASKVYELNRLCRIDNFKEPLSQFVSGCLKQLKSEDWIIVSYADTGMSHNGYIYQACNFIYTGKTKQRTDKYVGAGKHSRHYDKTAIEIYRQVRTAKHRYVYFATSKGKAKLYLKALNYPICDYPKEKNKNYILGEYQKPTVIKVCNKSCETQEIYL